MFATARVQTVSATRQFGADLQAGAVVACFTIILSLSFGSLIFSGELSAANHEGVLVALLTAVITGLIVTWRSSYPVTIAIPQDRTAPILALMAGVIVAGLPADLPPAVKATVVLAATALTTFLTGLTLFLIGRYRLGNVFRFIPYPVVGGFLAGSGWLLATGAFRVMLDFPMNFHSLQRLFASDELAKWLPGVAFGTILFGAVRKYRRALLVPGLVAGAVIVFYAVALGTGSSVASLRAGGWLPAPPASGSFHLQLWSLGSLGQLDGRTLLTSAGIAGTIVLTALISILLNTSGLELVVHEEININRELEAAGIANLIGGLAGGMPGFQSLSLTRLAHDLGAGSRRTGFVAAALCGLALVAGPAPLALLPNFVVGGLLFYLGLGFLFEWGYDAAFRLPRADYGVVLLILCVVGGVGYLEGVLTGVLAAVFLFIHNYSRIGVVTHAHTGADRQSNVERPLTHQRLLRTKGSEIQILRLHGFIFFGTSARVLDQIRERGTNPRLPRLQFVVLDFRQVSGIDSSATLSLARARQLAEKQGFLLCLARVPAVIRQQLVRAGFADEAGPAFRFFPDLDHALEWCEEQILAMHGDEIGATMTLREQLEAIWPRPEHVARLLPYLERQEVATETFLIRQGDDSDALYFLEAGEVTTRLELGSGHFQRLRRQAGGTVLGELGLFLGIPRTASVVVEKPCVVHRLSAQALQRLKAEAPDVAAEFHEFLVRYMAERIVNCNKTIRALAE